MRKTAQRDGFRGLAPRFGDMLTTLEARNKAVPVVPSLERVGRGHPTSPWPSPSLLAMICRWLKEGRLGMCGAAAVQRGRLLTKKGRLLKERGRLRTYSGRSGNTRVAGGPHSARASARAECVQAEREHANPYARGLGKAWPARPHASPESGFRGRWPVFPREEGANRYPRHR